MSPYMYCVTCSDQCIVVSWSLSVFWIVEENAIDDYKDLVGDCFVKESSRIVEHLQCNSE